ncbi:hypothetical protein SAMN05444166_8416 [Singulisphaera sp. GP187]|nr:hypothetical protein SAMN05444166_8416 [Singulisphaera sp. GP187]
MNVRLCGAFFLAVIAFPAADVAADSATLMAEPPPRLVQYTSYYMGVTSFPTAGTCTTVTVVIVKWNGSAWVQYATPTPGWEANPVLQEVNWGGPAIVLAPGTFKAVVRFYNGSTLLNSVETNTLTWP